MDEYERERAEKKLLMKLQEGEEAVKDGEGWLSLDELKAAMGDQCMKKLRINPLVAKDLKEIRDFVSDDNPDKSAETIDIII